MRHIVLHHFAYLRAVAKGREVAECAARCLGSERGHKVRSGPTRRPLTLCARSQRMSESPRMRYCTTKWSTHNASLER